MKRLIYLATSNSGKLRDFAGAAAVYGIELDALPGFASLPLVEESGVTFDANARLKAEAYSRHAPEQHAIVLADDSGLEVDALGGAPGVASARYAAMATDPGFTANSGDAENNARLLRELATTPEAERTARFVCVIAAARAGQILATFRGEAPGRILTAPRGTRGFGYDPLFYSVRLKKTFAELSPEEKAAVSHRGLALARFLDWSRSI
ncbi:MAG: RdgB/HAM1 family non-canonical purine NTP pyrophosphatase [Candidatus Koribacter versatilis]|uniref:dITP/XTP pyrophosphatase n=1 Tax=Candidatus Korobacter versatilis TaxID=658062 RepID=A0A932A6J2_9BACT|nr:RdgB/HAM1 family non-canonical purine NTP pyrophosphatase [Candidatus Koribacter versatilis]